MNKSSTLNLFKDVLSNFSVACVLLGYLSIGIAVPSFFTLLILKIFGANIFWFSIFSVSVFITPLYIAIFGIFFTVINLYISLWSLDRI